MCIPMYQFHMWMFTMLVLSCITTALSMPQNLSKILEYPQNYLPNHWELASLSENCQSKGNGDRLGWYKTDRLFEFFTLDKEFRIAVWFLSFRGRNLVD